MTRATSSAALVAGEPLRILQVIAPGEFGGAETVVVALVSGLATRGLTVRCAVTLASGAPVPLQLAGVSDAGAEVDVLRPRRRGYLSERRVLEGIMREFGPHVVHTHGYRSDVVGGAAARRRGVPMVATAHGFTGGDLKNRVYTRLQRRAWRHFDAVIAVSAALAGELEAALGARTPVHILTNAWSAPGEAMPRADARAALGLAPEGAVVGWVGRLSPEKGPDLLLDAAAKLRGEPVTVSFIGDGSESEDLRAQSRALGIESRVRWHGPLADAWRYMKAFDVLALSSRTEGTPMILFEAAHAGVPVVATAVGGVPDVLGSEGGWLVPPEDPTELAQAIREALKSSARAKRATGNLTKRVSSLFGLEPWLEAHERLYRLLARQERLGATPVW